MLSPSLVTTEMGRLGMLLCFVNGVQGNLGSGLFSYTFFVIYPPVCVLQILEWFNREFTISDTRFI
jgi:hypothetical protein